MVLVLIFIVLMFTMLSPRFATISNGQTILELASVLALLAIGQTFVILTGGIDLSVGSVLALSGVVAAKMVQGNPDMFVPAIIGGVGVGLICGLINGTLVAYARVPSFIVTLGMMTSASGLAYYISNGSPVSNLPKNYLSISTLNLATEGGFQLKIPVVLMVIGVRRGMAHPDQDGLRHAHLRRGRQRDGLPHRRGAGPLGPGLRVRHQRHARRSRGRHPRGARDRGHRGHRHGL